MIRRKLNPDAPLYEWRVSKELGPAEQYARLGVFDGSVQIREIGIEKDSGITPHFHSTIARCELVLEISGKPLMRAPLWSLMHRPALLAPVTFLPSESGAVHVLGRMDLFIVFHLIGVTTEAPK